MLVTEAIDFREKENDPADYDGHGTHIAGLAAAIDDNDGLVGVAPGVNVRSMKVLNGDETSTSEYVEMASVIAAVEYITGQKLSNPDRPMVVNLSLGADVQTPVYNALDEAIAASIVNGVTYVISSGNQGFDAKNISPAHVREAITVGAYDMFDRHASFSNYGSLIDILAPGTDLISLISDAQTLDADYVMMSGTSMAAGYVSGAVALFLAENPQATPRDIEKVLHKTSPALILHTPPGTTNRTIDVPALLGSKLPPFFDYAIASGGNITVSNFFSDNKLTVSVAPGKHEHQNTNVFANGNLAFQHGDNQVHGFGYYGGGIEAPMSTVFGVTQSLGSVFKPVYNPTGQTSVQQANAIDIPDFDAKDYESLATHRINNSLFLRGGTYTLGTREEPAIWYINGDLVIARNTRVTGYGVFLVDGDIQVFGSLKTDANSGETTLGLYASDNIRFMRGSPNLSAQILAGDAVHVDTNLTLYGNIVADDDVDINNAKVKIYYQPASSALTDPFWPMNQ